MTVTRSPLCICATPWRRAIVAAGIGAQALGFVAEPTIPVPSANLRSVGTTNTSTLGRLLRKG